MVKIRARVTKARTLQKLFMISAEHRTGPMYLAKGILGFAESLALAKLPQTLRNLLNRQQQASLNALIP